MPFYLVDLMPVFWAVLLVVSVSAASQCGAKWLVLLTVPGLIGFAFYAVSYPARTQVAAAVGTAALVLAVRMAARLVRLVRRREANSDS